jgi:hypothetical protein
MEKYSNNAFTTLVEAIDATSDPSIFTVSNTSGFPSSGNFRVIIDSEILIVTNVSGSLFTATRGAEGSPIQAHAIGAGVRHIFTAGSLNQILSDNIQTGAYASMPSSPSRLGQMYVPTDDNVIMVSDGSNWLPYGPIYPIQRPDLSGMTQINMTGATFNQTAFSAQLVNTNTTSGSRRGAVKSTITAPYKITLIYSQTTSLTTSDRSAGLWIRDSGTGKLITFEIAMSFARIGVHQWNSATSFNNSPMAWTSTEYTGAWLKYLQIYDDGVNHKFNWSIDGVYWLTVYSQSRTSWLASPNQYGFHCGENPQTVNFLSFKEESA